MAALVTVPLIVLVLIFQRKIVAGLTAGCGKSTLLRLIAGFETITSVDL